MATQELTFKISAKGAAEAVASLKGVETGVKNIASGEVSNATAGLTKNLNLLAAGAVLAAGAIGGVVTALTSALKATVAYDGSLQDLNDQTGIGVSNLSALRIAFDKSGGSIESGSKSLAKYLRGVSDANTGNDKLRQKFLDVGFTVEDLNNSYGDSDTAVEILVKRIGELGNSQDRLNALQKLGVKNGTELNGAIIAMEGNLRKFREEQAKLGLVVTPEQAKAADQFDESLVQLETQVKAMSFSIARQYIPEVTGAIGDISGALASNAQGWSAWGDFIKTEIRGVRIAAAGLAAFLANISRLDFAQAIGVGVVAGVVKSRQLHLEDSLGAGVSVNLGRPRDLGDTTVPRTGGGGRGRTGKSDAQKEAERAAREEAAFQKQVAEDAKRAADRQIESVLKLNEQYKLLNDQIHGVDTTTATYAVSQLKLTGGLKDQAEAVAAAIDRLTLLKKVTELAASAFDRLKESVAAQKEAVLDTLGGVSDKPGNVLSEEDIASLGKLPDDLITLSQKQIIAIDTLRDSFSGLGNAVGSVVESFVLLGESGTSIRKFTAQVLAGVAAQAAVKAVFELAEGFASLFFNPAAAAAHFTAAGYYGAISGVAAIAGRAVAGTAFQNTTRGGGAVTGGGGSTTTTRSGPQTINAGRSVVEHVYRIELGPDLIKKEIIRTVRTNNPDVNDAFRKAAR